MNKPIDIKKLAKTILKNPYNFAKKKSVNELVDILKQLSHYYYNTNNSLLPDDIYDILRDVLEKKDPENIFLDSVGAPIAKNRVDLPYSMPSLNKIKSAANTLGKWISKYSGPYVISDKLDGVSALLVRDSNKFKLYTRGDGRRGQDISYLVPYILPKNVKVSNFPQDIAIRGELIISKKNFKRISNKFKNSRNTVAGLVNAKKYSKKIAKITDFVAYAVINPKYKQNIQMIKMLEWHIPTVNFMIRKKLDNNMLSNYLIKRRKESKYDIDGIVVIDSTTVYKLINKNPKHGFAFKMVLTDQIAEAKVLDVIWQVSRHGYLKPRIRLEPVTIGSVTIKYVTAHNAKYIVANVLGPGAVIELVRSGDVIPFIRKVLKIAATGKPKMPDIPYKWTKTRVDIIVEDIHGDAADNIITKRITRFFQVLEVKYISDGIVGKIVEAGYKDIITIL